MLKRNRGFTLIELLVVLAIIALLTSIVFPVYHSLGVRRDKTTCAFNLRAIGQGLRLYVEDFGAYPPDRSEQGLGLLTLIGRSEGSSGQMTQVSAEYLRKLDILHCPRNPRDWEDSHVAPYHEPGKSLPTWPVADPALGGWNNYDAAPLQSTGALEPRYLRSRFAADDRDSKRQLPSRHPPADTVVTWCTFHYRDETGENPGQYDLALVLFSDSSVENVFAHTEERGWEIARARHRESPGAK